MDIVASGLDPVRTASGGPTSWQDALRRAVRDPAELCQLLELPSEFQEQAARASRLFPIFAPREFIARMRPRDPHDPLLRQVLPLTEELQTHRHFSSDPVDDWRAEVVPGLLQKYPGRALLITTGVCAVHCRYCFRREYPYSEAPKSIAQWEPAIERIRQDRSLEEVILSGGDPLTLVDSVLSELSTRLASIEHLRRFRIHTRLPVVIPARVDKALLTWLTANRLTKLVVIHANHPAELDASVEAAVARLLAGGIQVLNQAVLLRGVNDELAVLRELSLRLIEIGVTPYYLHQLDRVRGAAHFEVPVTRGIELIRQLRDLLPGYAVPRYVREVPGTSSKQPLA